MKIHPLVVLISLLQLLTACAHQSLSSTSANTLGITPSITLAGSLTEQAPQLIKQHGAVVIDLRHPDEGIESEAQQMRALEVPYFNLPVSPDSFSRTTVSQFEELLSAHAGRPIVIHCQSGNRAGLIWAALLKERGLSSAAAAAAVSGIVTKPEVNEAIRSYNVELAQ